MRWAEESVIEISLRGLTINNDRKKAKPRRINYKISFLAGCFAAHTGFFRSLALDKSGVVLSGKKSSAVKMGFLTAGLDFVIERGYFWDTLVICSEDRQVIRFGGIAKDRSLSIQNELNSQTQAYIKRYYRTIVPDLKQAYLRAASLFNGQRYIRYPIAQQWLKSHEHLRDGVCRQDLLRYLDDEAALWAEFIRPFLDNTHHIGIINEAYIQTQLSRYQGYFDQVESNPLTEKQRKACVIDEQNNLVLAGAGTGKTSTMIGRAGYLLTSGSATTGQILMLAYANKAAKEMEERIQDKLGIDTLTVKTFHALGKQIITEVEGAVPAIDKMAEDGRLKAKFVDEQIKRFLLDDRYKSRVVTYFSRFTYPYKSQFAFKTLGAYNHYILENELRTLQGELVKSYEECEIANYLYRQGVLYRYEANYEVNTAGPDYKAYQPDFFLPEYGIYIEHFGVNERNETPPFIDQATYFEGMAWKRALHETHQTRLIETFSYTSPGHACGFFK